MKRTLSLVLALVMVLGTFSTVFAAVEDDAADVLEQIGVLLGDDDGNLMLDKNLERRDSVVLLTRLLGVEDEAAEFLYTEELPSWGDVDSDPYYLGYLAWAESNEYYQGDDLGNFNPRNPITAQEFLLVLFRALGYEDPAWGEEFELAEELGLLEGTDLEEKDELLRGAMSVLILNALNTNVNGEDVTLAEKLEIEMPAPAALEVAAVVADNLKEVEVVFNQEVDKDTVVKANVYVKNQAGEVVLKDDGVTAVITLDTDKELKNQTEYTLVVDKVEAASGVVIEKTEVKFRAFDAELPEVLGLEVTGPRQLTLTFSEPVKKADGKVTVKQGNVTVGNSFDAPGTNKVYVTAYTNFVEGREYEVRVEGFEDYAEYKNIVEVLTFTYEKDETPPVATIEKVEQEYVMVSFNKPVKGLKLSNFYHTFSAWTAVRLEDGNGTTILARGSSNATTAAYDKVKVVFWENDDDKAIPAGSTVFGINGKDIKDNWGNALGNQEFTISAAADRVAPEVESIEVKKDNQLKITFSKEVKFERKNIEILDADGKKISGLYISSVSASPEEEFTVKYNKDLAGKTVTVSIKDVKDTTLYENVLSLYTEVIEIVDKEAPSVTNVYAYPDPEKKASEIVIVFDKNVDADTALNIANYTLVDSSNQVYLLDGNAEYDVLESRVKLTLTEDDSEDLDDKLNDTSKLQVINVKDLAGNTITPRLIEISEVDESASVTYDVIAKTTKQLVVEFNTRLVDLDEDYFDVMDKGYGEKFTLTQQDSDTKTTLIFDLADDVEIEHDKSNASFKISDAVIKNIFGQIVTMNRDLVEHAAIEDEIAPEVAEEDGVVLEDNDTVTIIFTELMDHGSFSNGSFSVEGRTLDDYDLDDDSGVTVLTLNLVEKTDVEGFAGVLYNLQVKDDAGNALDLDTGIFDEVEYE